MHPLLQFLFMSTARGVIDNARDVAEMAREQQMEEMSRRRPHPMSEEEFYSLCMVIGQQAGVDTDTVVLIIRNFLVALFGDDAVVSFLDRKTP